jgi:hypothetical protein
VRVLASELWWVLLVVGCAEAIRRGVSMWVVFPTAFLVDIWLTLQLEVVRPFWLWLLNVLVISVGLQLAVSVAAVEALQEIRDDPPAALPTDALQALAVELGDAGFTPVTHQAVLIGDPMMHVWVLHRDDGTLAELLHREPHPAGFAFTTRLRPALPGYGKILSVPWRRGWPEPGTRRVERPRAECRALLAAHDAALAEAVAQGARPAPVSPDDALAIVLADDRAAARRVMERPWRSMVGAHLRALRRASA